jgi:hypothetical protein
VRGAGTATGDCAWIGVDCGASSAKAWIVERGPEGFCAGRICARGDYQASREFAPLSLELQLAERGHARQTVSERARADEIGAAIAECVRTLASVAGTRRALVAACAPGLKTADGRGIEVLRHGPRAPRLAADLERRLAELGIALERPIGPLGSDGDAAGLGEERAARGAFRGARTAYWLGGGTGVAEALKLGGKLVAMDAAAGWLEKAWRMRSSLFPDESAEDLIAPGRLAARWMAAGGAGFPEDAAEAGDARARELCRRSGRALAELVAARARAFAARGTPLERCVIGARLALLWRSARGRWIREAASAELDRALGAGSAERLFVASELEAAPAIGALAAALGA